MSRMDPIWRAMPTTRLIFEETILDHTMEDEPFAPPVRVINDIDDESTPPWEFHYTNHMWHGEGVPAPDMFNLPSCDCHGGCDPKSKTCACLKRQQAITQEYTPDFAYDKRGLLKHPDIPIFECNDLCLCGDECRNRVSWVHKKYCSKSFISAGCATWPQTNGEHWKNKGKGVGCICW
jgi:histone-lysine N-methyltransferase SUV39H